MESRRLRVGSRREFLGRAAHEIHQRQDSNSGTFGWCFGPVEAPEYRMYRLSRLCRGVCGAVPSDVCLHVGWIGCLRSMLSRCMSHAGSYFRSGQGGMPVSSFRRTVLAGVERLLRRLSQLGSHRFLPGEARKMVQIGKMCKVWGRLSPGCWGNFAFPDSVGGSAAYFQRGKFCS